MPGGCDSSVRGRPRSALVRGSALVLRKGGERPTAGAGGTRAAASPQGERYPLDGPGTRPSGRNVGFGLLISARTPAAAATRAGPGGRGDRRRPGSGRSGRGRAVRGARRVRAGVSGGGAVSPGRA